MPRRYTIGILIVLVACCVAIVLAFGYYPIANVNGTTISARTFRAQLAGARTYSRHARDTYAEAPTSSIQFAAASDAELAGLVLDTAIENALVHKGLRDLVGDNAHIIVEEKVDTYASQGELASAAQTLFGLSTESFREHILTPQAEREVLGSKLFLEGKTIDVWLRETRTSARVNIFSPRYAWDGSKVIAR